MLQKLEMEVKVLKTIKILLIIWMVLIIGFLSGCEEKDIIIGKGKIRYNNLEGGFYGIVSDEDEQFDPVNLPSEFEEDSI